MEQTQETRPCLTRLDCMMIHFNPLFNDGDMTELKHFNTNVHNLISRYPTVFTRRNKKLVLVSPDKTEEAQHILLDYYKYTINQLLCRTDVRDVLNIELFVDDKLNQLLNLPEIVPFFTRKQIKSWLYRLNYKQQANTKTKHESVKELLQRDDIHEILTNTALSIKEKCTRVQQLEPTLTYGKIYYHIKNNM